MNVNLFHLLSKTKKKVASYLLSLIAGRGNPCGTQNHANRDAWLEHIITSIPAGQRILDAGAGELRYKPFCSHLNYVSQDFAQYDGKGDKKGLQIGKWDQSKLDIISDIISIPEPSNSFDAIICIEVFEHLPEPTKAIKEFARLLKPCGHLIITAPFCSLTHFAPHHFYTGFNRYFYETLLPANGFKIIEIEKNGNYFEYIAQEIRRVPWVAKHYAEKGKCTRLESLAMVICLQMLKRFSKKDSGSTELLCFGLHIHAIKEL